MNILTVLTVITIIAKEKKLMTHDEAVFRCSVALVQGQRLQPSRNLFVQGCRTMRRKERRWKITTHRTFFDAALDLVDRVGAMRAVDAIAPPPKRQVNWL